VLEYVQSIRAQGQTKYRRNMPHDQGERGSKPSDCKIREEAGERFQHAPAKNWTDDAASESLRKAMKERQLRRAQ
jgi:hypothetical protein